MERKQGQGCREKKEYRDNSVIEEMERKVGVDEKLEKLGKASHESRTNDLFVKQEFHALAWLGEVGDGSWLTRTKEIRYRTSMRRQKVHYQRNLQLLAIFMFGFKLFMR